MTNDALINRLNQALTRAGLSDRAASLKAGLGTDAIRNIRRGKAPGYDRLQRLAKGLDVTTDWLIGDTSTSLPSTAATARMELPISGTTQFQAAPTGARDLPVLGAAMCGDDGAFDFNGQVIEYIRRPQNLDGVTGAYALYVTGESMAPRYMVGEIVHVHPGKPISPGCYVVAQIRNGDPHTQMRGMIKQYIKRDNDIVSLNQINPQRMINISSSDVIALHRIVGSSE
ncbi:S24 family peptidase [Tistrella bauzanensis]|uniref:XRE family transcriptional regulator n=1 Tax=Tistrella TaxID=171436 RepID=UPI0031F68FFD